MLNRGCPAKYAFCFMEGSGMRRTGFAGLVTVLMSMSSAFGQWTAVPPVTSVTRDSDGIRATVQSGGVLKLQVCTDSIIHVLYSPNGNFPKRPDYVVTKTSWSPSQWKLESSTTAATLSTSALKV